MSARSDTGSSKPLGRPLGTGRDWRRRLLLHHVPLAVASGAVLVLFMGLSLFTTGGWPRMEMMGSSPFPTAMNMGDRAGPDGGLWQYLPVALALTGLIALLLVNDSRMLYT